MSTLKNWGAGQTPATTTVTTSTTEIVPKNRSRKFLILTNIGTGDCYISFGEDAILSRGILLGASGGSLVMDDDGISSEAVNGIVASGTSAVIYQEAI